ncbi:MAG: chitobiase/beta-hexosaminidase C-terminal domain-containing protein [Roseburia sp.]|nr:chitobiase/beta-hexosaminidase C-terminal domain-containing protein [Roseburia sp.]
MKCPKCGNELEEGKLLCENCGEEVKFVPVFDIELEAKLSESITSMLKEISAEEFAGEGGEDAETRELPETEPPGRPTHIKVVGIIAIAAVLLAAAGISLTAMITASENKKRENSYEYQYEQAVVYASEENYAEAIGHLERALAINDDLDARLLLAKYYDAAGRREDAVLLLQGLLGADSGYAHREEVYELLFAIYEEESEYGKINALAADCDIQRLVARYNKYTALMPEFNKTGGVYDEVISITLTGNTQGEVHYTMDGSEPTDSSPVYETPILLESGDYLVRARFINIYGVESEIASQSYYISLSAPPPPAVNCDSGNYDRPALIEVYHDDNTKIYYTSDGTAPTKSSARYSDPIEMPYGVSNFAFMAVGDTGLCSEVVNRTYQMNIQANFTAEAALQVLVNSLCADGRLIDLEGHVENKLGTNQYHVVTLAKVGETVYYIIYEEYADPSGNAYNTNNIYAVDVNTADLYRAYKLDEGKYDLRDFSY